MIHSRTLISFPVTDEYISASFKSLGKERIDLLEKAQSTIKEGAPIYAMTPAAYLLDHQRNHIVHPVYGTPQNVSATEYREFLLKEGFRYILWDYNALGSGYTTADSRGTLEKLANLSKLLFWENEVVVMDIEIEVIRPSS